MLCGPWVVAQVCNPSTFEGRGQSRLDNKVLSQVSKQGNKHRLVWRLRPEIQDPWEAELRRSQVHTILSNLVRSCLKRKTHQKVELRLDQG